MSLNHHGHLCYLKTMWPSFSLWCGNLEGRCSQRAAGTGQWFIAGSWASRTWSNPGPWIVGDTEVIASSGAGKMDYQDPFCQWNEDVQHCRSETIHFHGSSRCKAFNADELCITSDHRVLGWWRICWLPEYVPKNRAARCCVRTLENDGSTLIKEADVVVRFSVIEIGLHKEDIIVDYLAVRIAWLSRVIK